MSEETKKTETEHDLLIPEYKVELVRYRHAVYKVCRDCGRLFAMSDNDVITCVQKYGSIPLRCPQCRENRKKYFDSLTEEKNTTENTEKTSD